MVDLRVSLGSLTLPNPVLVAAGTFGYGLEFAKHVRLDALGGIVTKTLTRQPRPGNPPPRLVETPSGLLNAVGLQNIGLEAFLREKLPALRACRAPLIVSVMGELPDELAEMVQRLDATEGVSAIELNLSCPNIRENSEFGIRNSESELRIRKMVAQDAEATFQMVQAARSRTRKPLIVKLSPDVTDLAPIARSAERAGASALSLVNTFIGMSLDPSTRRSRLGVMTGGLSGPAIRPLAVYRVWYTAQVVTIPIVGLGGIVRADDALEFFLAGASAVAVGTATFADPRASLRVLQGVTRYVERHGYRSLDELRGALSCAPAAPQE